MVYNRKLSEMERKILEAVNHRPEGHPKMDCYCLTELVSLWKTGEEQPDDILMADMIGHCEKCPKCDEVYMEAWHYLANSDPKQYGK